MNEIEAFDAQVKERVHSIARDESFKKLSNEWMLASLPHKYSYNYSSMGRPIIQYPQDIVAMQELIWKVKPDLIIETGIAHGGSLIMNASMLALIDYCEAAETGSYVNPAAPHRKVLGIDVEIRTHNRDALESHPMAQRVEMIEGSSIDPGIVAEVRGFASGFNRILVCLDSNHTHSHVLAELEAYTPLVAVGSYCVVFDTVIEDLPGHFFSDRPWSVGNSPKTAVHEFLREHSEFDIDHEIDDKLQLTVAPDGFLKRLH